MHHLIPSVYLLNNDFRNKEWNKLRIQSMFRLKEYHLYRICDL